MGPNILRFFTKSGSSVDASSFFRVKLTEGVFYGTFISQVVSRLNVETGYDKQEEQVTFGSVPPVVLGLCTGRALFTNNRGNHHLGKLSQNSELWGLTGSLAAGR